MLGAASARDGIDSMEDRERTSSSAGRDGLSAPGAIVLVSVLAWPLGGGGAGTAFLGVAAGSGGVSTSGTLPAASLSNGESASESSGLAGAGADGRGLLRSFVGTLSVLVSVLIDLPCRELGGGGGAFLFLPICTEILESDSEPSSCWTSVANALPPSRIPAEGLDRLARFSCDPLKGDDEADEDDISPTRSDTICDLVGSGLEDPSDFPVINSRRKASTSSAPLARLPAFNAAPSSSCWCCKSSSFFASSRSCRVLLKGFGGALPVPKDTAGCEACCTGASWSTFWFARLTPANGSSSSSSIDGNPYPSSTPPAACRCSCPYCCCEEEEEEGALNGHAGVSGDCGGGESTRTFLTTLLFFLWLDAVASAGGRGDSAGAGGSAGVLKLTGGGGVGAGEVSSLSRASTRSSGRDLRNGLEFMVLDSQRRIGGFSKSNTSSFLFPLDRPPEWPKNCRGWVGTLWLIGCSGR